MICRTLVVQCRRVGEIPLAESSFFFTNIKCFGLISADDLSESDAPVPTGQRNLTAESSFCLQRNSVLV